MDHLIWKLVLPDRRNAADFRFHTAADEWKLDIGVGADATYDFVWTSVYNVIEKLYDTGK